VTHELSGIGTGTIIYCLESRLGIRGCFMTGVRPVFPDRGFIGRARTLRCLPPRTDLVQAQREAGVPTPHRAAIDGIGEGEVLVIEARGELDAAVVGDVLAARVKAAGGAGIVTDGCVRDLPGLRALDFPIFSAGVHASTFSNRHLGIAVDVPVSCGRVTVLPGDLLVGDEEGVAVVPGSVSEKLAVMAREQEELDEFSLRKIAQGAPLSRAFPLDAAYRAEFDGQRKETS
jgi:5-oxopent-3-ene-1,2,5-tricarboxylate decarboxylase / 2-hydroxyhepta-2,4-diene-1,7-dioate isomerase